MKNFNEEFNREVAKREELHFNRDVSKPANLLAAMRQANKVARMAIEHVDAELEKRRG